MRIFAYAFAAMYLLSVTAGYGYLNGIVFGVISDYAAVKLVPHIHIDPPFWVMCVTTVMMMALMAWMYATDPKGTGGMLMGILLATGLRQAVQ